MDQQGSEREVRDGTLTLKAREGASGCTLAVAGELDLANAGSLSGELAKLETSGAPLQIDLSKLEFIDSTGIAIIVGAYQRLGERLRLVPSTAPDVRRVMSLTGLDAALPFAPSPDGEGD